MSIADERSDGPDAAWVWQAFVETGMGRTEASVLALLDRIIAHQLDTFEASFIEASVRYHGECQPPPAGEGWVSLEYAMAAQRDAWRTWRTKMLADWRRQAQES